jgi:hypothetical protein
MSKNAFFAIGFAVVLLLLGTFAFSYFKPSQPALAPAPITTSNPTTTTTTNIQTITPTPPKPQPAPTSTPVKSSVLRISTLSPASGTEGTQVTITGNGFSATDNMVYFGGTLETVASSNGATVTFTISPCPYSPSGRVCPAHLLAGPGNVYVTNANGTSNILIFTVTQQS